MHRLAGRYPHVAIAWVLGISPRSVGKRLRPEGPSLLIARTSIRCLNGGTLRSIVTRTPRSAKRVDQRRDTVR